MVTYYYTQVIHQNPSGTFQNKSFGRIAWRLVETYFLRWGNEWPEALVWDVHLQSLLVCSIPRPGHCPRWASGPSQGKLKTHTIITIMFYVPLMLIVQQAQLTDRGGAVRVQKAKLTVVVGTDFQGPVSPHQEADGALLFVSQQLDVARASLLPLWGLVLRRKAVQLGSPWGGGRDESRLWFDGVPQDCLCSFTSHALTSTRMTYI